MNRLTFGARPGDLERVAALGVKKWIDLQLHPERIPENPVLGAKLRPLDTLTMSTARMLQDYPSPQQVKEMVAGRLPFPEDPDKRMMVDRLAARLKGKADGDGGQGHAAELATLLDARQLRILRAGTGAEKLDLFGSFPQARQDELLESMGQGMRMQLFAAAGPELRRRIQSANGPQSMVAQDLIEAKLLRAVYSNRQLGEVLADFWFNHFNVFMEKGADRYMVTAYERDTIRPHVLGKFEDLLRATAQSPAMLFYLDNWESVGAQSPAGKRRQRGLNENYGRELLELHTLGVDGGYSQKDVTEVARCFTGWTIKQPQRVAEFEFNARMHDDGEKTRARRTHSGGRRHRGRVQRARYPGAPSGDGAFHFAQTGACGSWPTIRRNAGERMAATFLKKDGDLRAVMKTMFEAPEFWSQGAYRAKMKSPLEMVASALRAVQCGRGLHVRPEQPIEPARRAAVPEGEPTGYSNSGEEWLNSAGLMARMNFSVALVNNKVPGVKVDGAPAAHGYHIRLPGVPEEVTQVRP